MPPINPESTWTRRIVTYDREGKPLRQGSGFVVEYGGQHLLVSNRHILAGLTTDNEYMDPKELPFSADVTFAAKDPSLTPSVVRLELINAALEAQWWQHPTHRHLVDVVALPLPADLPHRLQPITPMATWLVKQLGTEYQIPVELSVANTVFVVGFPLGRNAGNDVLSIWTQASVASEPSLELDERPRFLVDGATREGLSGAPVYAYLPAGSRSPAPDEEGLLRATLKDPMIAPVGIYSGRIDAKSDLGWVWKASLIDEIAAGKTPGTPIDDLLGGA